MADPDTQNSPLFDVGHYNSPRSVDVIVGQKDIDEIVARIVRGYDLQAVILLGS